MALARGILVWLPEAKVQRLRAFDQPTFFDRGFLTLRAKVLLGLEPEEVRRRFLSRPDPLTELGRYCLLGGDVTAPPAPEIIAPELVAIRSFYLGNRQEIRLYLPQILRSELLLTILLQTCSPEIMAELQLDSDEILTHNLDVKTILRHQGWLRANFRDSQPVTRHCQAYIFGLLGLESKKVPERFGLPFDDGHRHNQILRYQAGLPLDSEVELLGYEYILHYGDLPVIDRLSQEECWKALQHAIDGIWPVAVRRIANRIEEPARLKLPDRFPDRGHPPRRSGMRREIRALSVLLLELTERGFLFQETIWTSLRLLSGDEVDPQVLEGNDSLATLALHVGHPNFRPRKLPALHLGSDSIHDEVHFYSCLEMMRQGDLGLGSADFLRNYVRGTLLKFRGLRSWPRILALLTQKNLIQEQEADDFSDYDD